MEQSFVITGGNKLHGSIRVSGAKNAASKMMVASLLTDERVTLLNFPAIGEMDIVGELCAAVGSKLTHSSGKLSIHTPVIKAHAVLSLSRRNRIPILTLGPLLARCGKAEVPILGGDKIGPRPVGLHFDALEAMGANITVTETSYRAEAPNGLHGAKISFPFPSVGATENTILAAVLAKGKTLICNAAVEPEIIDLIKMLQKMGAIIGLGANRTIEIEGVERLRGTVHSVIPDRIEAASFACLAAATDGKIFVEDARQEDLITFLNAFRRIGGGYEVADNGISFFRERPLTGIEFETDTHPGFMTDWQQPFVALLTQARGVSVVHETIYEDRFAYVRDLNAMGANIKVFSKCLGEVTCRFNGRGCEHSAIISGPTPLVGGKSVARDLRAGVVQIIAALIAKGTSTIGGVHEIDRGYADIDGRLRKLGADIKRVDSKA
jgi:UDP-N-acetylglucosamine 1-carboxyvinyltransferase